MRKSFTSNKYRGLFNSQLRVVRERERERERERDKEEEVTDTVLTV